jgi:hypothetical protein
MRVGIGDKVVSCPLVGEILFHDCIRISQVIEERARLIRAKVLDAEDLECKPDLLYGFLSENLREYAEKLPKVCGKDWAEIAEVCKKCGATPDNTPIIGYPKKITNVNKDGLKVR